MITDAIIDFFLSPILRLLEDIGLPDLEPIAIPDNIFSVLLEVLKVLGYFLPMNIICTCLGFLFALDTFCILWALFLRVKSFASVRNWL